MIQLGCVHRIYLLLLTRSIWQTHKAYITIGFIEWISKLMYLEHCILEDIVNLRKEGREEGREGRKEGRKEGKEEGGRKEKWKEGGRRSVING